MRCHARGSAILLAALLAFSAVAQEQRPRRESPETLPPGLGQPLMLDACVQCHDFRAFVSQRKSQAAWRRTVNEMIWRGAPLMPGEADVVTQYLASAFGSETPVRVSQNRPASNDLFLKYLPPGPGRALVVAACVQCHDLATTVAKRKTPEAWRRSVEQMAHLGARLNGSEIRVVASYLAGAFGPDNPIPEEIKAHLHEGTR